MAGEDITVRVGADTKGLQAGLKKARTHVGGFHKSMSGLQKTAIGLGTAFGVIIGAKGLSSMIRGVVSTTAAFEKMRISLDTLTKGKGEEWFQKLNEWAMRMPISTEEAIQGFIRMRAMGMEPTIKQMEILVDAVSAVGAGSEGMQRVTRALGQMSAKGRVVQQELNQLAELGIPAMEILRSEFGLSAKEMENIGNAGIGAQEAIAAIFRYMEEHYGGLSQKIHHTWGGMFESLESMWKEFKRTAGDALTGSSNALKGLIDLIDRLYQEGKLQEWATEVGQVLDIVFTGAIDTVIYWLNALESMVDQAKRMRSGEAGVRGGILGPIKESPTQERARSMTAAWARTMQKAEGRLYILKLIKEEQQELAKLKTEYKKTEEVIEELTTAEDAHITASIRNIRDHQKALKDAIEEVAEGIKDEMEQWDEWKEKSIQEELAAFGEAQEEQAKYIEEALERDKKAYKNFWDYIKINTEELNQVTSDSFTDAFVAFANGTKTASDAFKDMVTSIMGDILRLYANRFFVDFINNIIGGFGGMFGGSTTTTAGGGAMSTSASFGHKGGVVGSTIPSRSYPAALFTGAPRLHSGLRADEFPAILQRGETVTPRGQPSIQINVINETGNKMEAEQRGDMRFDGKKWVMDMVLSGITTSLPFRQAIRGA